MTVGYHSIVALSLVVTLQGSPFRTPASLSGNRHTWDCRMISILWQGLVGGGATIRPSIRAFYGDSALLLSYWTQEPLRLGTIVSFPLACSGFTSRVADAWTHVGWLRMQSGATVGIGIR